MEREVFEIQAELCKALASPVRIEIVHHLGRGEQTVTQLQELTGLRLPNLSQHLRILKGIGLLRCRREGTAIHYRLTCPEVAGTCEQLRSLLAMLAESRERTSKMITIDRVVEAASPEPRSQARKEGK